MPDVHRASAEGPAAQLARALGGRQNGRGWIARCPAHDHRGSSLSIAAGMVELPPGIDANDMLERGAAAA